MSDPRPVVTAWLPRVRHAHKVRCAWCGIYRPRSSTLRIRGENYCVAHFSEDPAHRGATRPARGDDDG